MPLNIATRTHGLTFKTVVGGEECNIHPSSALFGKSLVDKNREDQDQQSGGEQRVLYSELVKTSKQYMRCVTNISFFDDAQRGTTFNTTNTTVSAASAAG